MINSNLTYVLLTIAALSVLFGANSASALNPPCPNCEDGDPEAMAEEIILSEIPISIWLEQESYTMRDTVLVRGHVANVLEGYAVTMQVRDPQGQVVSIGQIMPDENGDFETLLAASSWTETGIYKISVQYGQSFKNNKAQFVLTEAPPIIETSACDESMLEIMDECVPYEIDGGMVTGADVNMDLNSIVIHLDAYDDGMITLDFPPRVIEGIFMAIEGNEEVNDVQIDGQSITIGFHAGTDELEILGSRVIPEFGTIAILVLASAIVSVVVISARSGLSLVPRL